MHRAKTVKTVPTPSVEPVKIAVIGGGPKAAAIAAKAWVLRQELQANVQVTIFEPNEIGAYWSGKNGYTDGKQRLCTIAERDVGYPYNSMFGPKVDVSMASKFSWGTFLHTRPSGYEKGYSTWVDAGRRPPLHEHFAEYLKWVVAEASPQAMVIKKEVAGLRKTGEQWEVTTKDRKGQSATYASQFDATVVTGPGPAKNIPIKGSVSGVAAGSQIIFNGCDFWHPNRKRAVKKCLNQVIGTWKYSENAIVIIGAGGTAAAILAWLIGNGAGDLPIYLVAGQASLYTRVDSVFENRLFSDDTQWATLSSENRRAFFDRLNRGVVWATVMDRVSSASRLEMVGGRAKEISVTGTSDVKVIVERGDKKIITLGASMVIDCSGFDAWWFLSLLSGFPAVAPADEKQKRETWQNAMTESLRLAGDPWQDYPPLHVPMLSSELGPGFGSLMVLGSMAERILRPYSQN
ncbi:SidA/IucD/PvdA family monooxygenase [Massilia varians]|jgi:mycobactin lysine-N-oxygenase